VFRKTFTKPLPDGAETFTRKGERFARWKDRRGKSRTAPVTTGEGGADRIILESPYYVAKYRDGAGAVQVVPTGCRDETAARQVLADLERQAELVRSGVMTRAEAAIGEHQAKPLAEHFDAYGEHQQAAGVTPKHASESRSRLDRLAKDCSFATLGGGGGGTPKKGGAAAIKFPPPVPISHLATTAGAKVEWFWQDFIPERGIVLLTGLWKAGKTTLLIHLLKAAGEGQRAASPS
jgi:hypothetical protein